MLKLKLQYFVHLRRRADSLEKTLRLGKTEGKRRTRQQRIRRMASQTQWTWSKLREIVKHRLQSVGSQRVRHDLATEQQPSYYPARITV